MAEQMITVCDVCGAPTTQTITLKVGTRNLLKDLCQRHVAEIVKGARAPKRGRKPGSKSTGLTRVKKTTARKKSTGRRPGRPRKATTEAVESSS
jgi:hypothetical protein